MIKAALAGCGYWGSTVLKAILRVSGFELTCVYDKDPKKLEQVRRTYADAFSYAESYQEVLSDTSIDAVVLTVPCEAHFAMAQQALAAGKHVFIEKPFTRTLAQAERLRTFAKEKKLIIHVDHIMLYHPAVRKMKELLEKKAIGELRYMEMRRTSFGGSRTDVTVIQDLGIHDFSIIDYLTDGAKPLAVYSLSEKLGYPYTSISFTLLKYEGFSAQLTASWVSPAKERKIILGGTEKTLVFDEVTAPDKLVIYDKNASDDPCVIQLGEENALDNSLAHFLACARSGTDSLTDAASAIRIMKILRGV